MDKRHQQELTALSLTQAAALLEKKEASAAEITEAILAQLHDSRTNAYITVSDRATQAAAEADQRRSAGESRSFLDGVPIALADTICTEGLRTTCASRMLENFVPPYSAAVAEKLESAGAILPGKLNLDEFGAGAAGDTSFFGPVTHPADPTRVAGGANGGAAAAVAEGTAYAAIGNDCGGSIRLPAAFCGVVGLKPTYGLVSRYGITAFASSMDQAGICNKTVEDCALTLANIAGFDSRDANTLPGPPPDYRATLRGAEGLKGLRIGIPGDYMRPAIREDIRRQTLDLAESLRRAGAEVDECALPHAAYALSAYYVISSAEFNSNMARYDGTRFGYRSKNYDSYDDMLLKTRAEGFGDEVKRRILFGIYTLRADRFEDSFLRAQKVRTKVIEDYQKAFSTFDLLLTPTAPVTAWPLGTVFADPAAAAAMELCTVSASLTGLPAISLPWGTDGDGLPIGIQLTGPSLSEALILKAAHGIEELRQNR